MPDIYRERTYTRERDDSVSSDDDRYQKKTTVRRYKVGGGGGGGGGHVERVERERIVEEVDDDRRSRYSARASQGDLLLDPRDRGGYLPERPRSAFEPSPRTTTVVERKVVERDSRERDREYYSDRDFCDRDSRSRVVERKQVVEREDDRWDDRGERRISYEKTKEVERERERDRDRAPLSGR